MHLHALAGPIVGIINPNRNIVLRHSVGYATASDGTQEPQYSAPIVGVAQIQPISTGDRRHLASLNIQGVFKSIYLYGQWYGVIRADRKGGDLLEFDGKRWMVIEQPEDYPDQWSRVIVVLLGNIT